MRAFYLGYSKVAPAVRQFNDLENLRILSQIPWSHNVVLMEKLDDIEERCWYAHKAIEHGWSRNMLAMWIESGLHKREGKGVTNFQRTLPAPQSDMAQQTIKDPYIFDFLTLQEKHFEKDLEDGLVDHIQKFLLELGQGFAFMGRQYPLTVSGKQYYADLLFYHVKLKCYFVVRIEGDGIRPQGYRTAEFLSFSS
jgi:predicted nuclease of restriction endonuclease-like (RecB) superfamily